MSLFAVVQGRIPPVGPKPQAPMAQPQMAAPSPAIPGMMPPDPNAPPPMPARGAPMPGFVVGGSLGFEEDYNRFGQTDPSHKAFHIQTTPPDGFDADYNPLFRKDPSHNAVEVQTGPQGFDDAYAPLFRKVIPAYGIGDDIPMSSDNPDSTGGDNGGGAIDDELNGIMADLYSQDEANGIDQTDPNYQARLFYKAKLQQSIMHKQDALDAQRAAGSGPGPDHFYEQLAFDAQQAAQQRRDAMQAANASQANEEQAAQQAYKSALVSADTDRKQLMNTAVSNAQDAYAKLLSQADPEQGALWRRPSQGVLAMQQAQGPTWAAPTLPKAVFPEGWA